MTNIARCVRKSSLLRDTRGANMVEYMIMVGLVALGALAAFNAFGGNVTAKITEEGGKVQAITTGQ
jgi:Flp pilus assembly pilin Flp